MKCPGCNGSGCSGCDDDGHFSLPEPAFAYATPMIWVAELADVWRKGTPPVMGGSLDQCYKTTTAVRMFWADEDQYRAEALGPLAAMMG